MALLRDQLRFAECTRATELARIPHGGLVPIAGVVTGRQRPSTGGGIVFMTVEDETGNTNVLVRMEVQERRRKAILGSHIVVVNGIFEINQRIAHVLAGSIEDVSEALSELAPSSSDFH